MSKYFVAALCVLLGGLLLSGCPEEPVEAGTPQGEFEAKIAELEAQVSTSEDKVSDLEMKVTDANRQIEELEHAAEIQYRELYAKYSALDASVKARALIGELGDFIKANPQEALSEDAKELRQMTQKRLEELLDMEAERDAQHAVEDFRTALSAVKDGFKLDSENLVKLALLLTEKYPLAFLKRPKMPTTTLREAMADPDAVRAEIMHVDGSVVQFIEQRAGDDFKYHMGIIVRDLNYYYFIAIGSTKGVSHGKRMRFVGVFSQKYTYETAREFKDTPVIVGYFDIPDNR